MQYMILSVFFPVLAGVYLLIKKERGNRKYLLVSTGAFLVITAILVVLALCLGREGMFTLFSLTERLPILFKIDEISVVFSVLAVLIFLCAGFFSFEYMKHERRKKMFFAYYVMTYGVTAGIALAGNLVTMYLCYEMLTLVTFPLVLFPMTREAKRASRRYLYYSIGGAAFAQEDQVQSYAHPTLFGTQSQVLVDGDATYQVGGQILKTKKHRIAIRCFGAEDGT